MSRFSNTLDMMILLRSRGKMKIKELAEVLEVKERMIRKYKGDLEKAGVDIESIPGTYGGYYLKKGYDFLLNLNITNDEYIALQLANVQLKDSNFIYSKELQMLENKIDIAQKRNARELLKVDGDYLFKEVHANNGNNEREKCLNMYAAIISRNKVKIKYFSLGKGESERVVHPYTIMCYKGSHYCVAYCENRKGVREFKLSRVREYEILKDKYERDKKFSIEEYTKDSIGIYKDEMIKLKLLISKPMSYIVSEKIWVENQKIQWNEDESIIFEAELQGKTEIISWILSMGSDVKVLEPVELKEEILKKLEDTLKLYKEISNTDNIVPHSHL